MPHRSSRLLNETRKLSTEPGLLELISCEIGEPRAEGLTAVGHGEHEV